MNKLPEFKPLPDVTNLSENYMSAFNRGMNIYEALVYLQGYVQITYSSLNDLIADWNNFEDYVTQNIKVIADEKTQEILNQWLSDGTLNNLIAKNPLWNQKVSVSGDTMDGNLIFAENAKIETTKASGDHVTTLERTYTGSEEYTRIGDVNSQVVINSNDRPVYNNGIKNQDLIVEDDLDEINANISSLQDNAEQGAYWNNNGNHDTLQDYSGDNKVRLLLPCDVIDSLDSSLTNRPLSAKQGKALNDKFSGLLNYSSDEIDTGMKWVDGRPIYKKYISVDLGTSGIISGSYDFGLGDIDYIFLDECSMLYSTKGDKYYWYSLGCIGSTSSIATATDITYASNNVYFDKDKINVECGESFKNWWNVFYLNVLYVKKSDKTGV